MKEITVMEPGLILRSGVVRLTEDQADRRRTCLKPYVDADGKTISGCYEIIAEQWFKAGETFGYDGDIGAFRPEMAEQPSDEKNAIIDSQRNRIVELEKALEDQGARRGPGRPPRQAAEQDSMR